MGFNLSSTTSTLSAKLTPFGRKQLVSTNNLLITKFSLGDSDANYYTSLTLNSGQVPTKGGTIGPNSTISNSTTQNVNIKSFLVLNNGVTQKPVETQSSVISSTIVSNGQTIISGNNITHNTINRNSGSTDNLVNLYYSFGLPLSSNQDNLYTGVTYNLGGYADTALSGIAKSNILVLGINNNSYGEIIDGKQIKINLVTSAGTYNIYSTFQNKGGSLLTEDANLRETSVTTSNIDSNIAFLFSDSIMKPNGGVSSLSWATGFGTQKPFSINNKQLYNLQTNSNLGLSADTIVGIAYLDKGFIVITHPTILNNYSYSVSSASTITFASSSTIVTQNITCIANRGEFGTSTNPTFSGVDSPRISEIGLYDDSNNLIALAKTDRHIVKNVNDFIALSVQITL